MSRRQRVLIIESSEPVRDQVGSRLTRLDVEIMTSETAEGGLDLARSQQPDLILADTALPDVSGFGVCHRLQLDPLTSDIPVILTGTDDPDDKVRAFELGAVDYVSKPFHADELQARVRLALKTRALLDMLEMQAQSDALTGLPNRAMLIDRLAQSIARSRTEPDYRFAVLFLDFDRFKIVNDSLGHEAGDLLLVSIAQRLAANVRSNDTASHGVGHLPARLGGDEFVILLDDIREYADATVVADRLQEALGEPHDLDGHEVTSTASIGIVTSAGGYDRAEDILRDADTAMYHAKSAGRARHVIFDERMHKEVLNRLKLEADLRQAVGSDQFSLAYQPIVSLSTGRLLGFEALLRWHHPTRGEVGPNEFIGVCEEIGLIVPMGTWVLREACRRLKTWHDRFPLDPPLGMNVNLSKRQLQHPDLVDSVRDVIASTGVDPSALKLEITESVIMDSPEHVTSLLQSLKDLGVQLCMDDFGTGYSSLSFLHKFPIDVLKIDRTFVLNTDENREYAAVIYAIITLAHTLKMSVVGEGVENGGQLAQLQALECDSGQGNYFARSMDAAAAEAFMMGPQGLARSA